MTLVGSPTRQTMSRPILVRLGLIPRSARICASCSCISAFVSWFDMITMLATAHDVVGVSMSHLNLLIHGKSHRRCRNLRSLVSWYCLRRKHICTTARSVASFHPSISVCWFSATFVCPSAMVTRKPSMALVMKPTTTAKMTRPKMIQKTKTKRRPILSGIESSMPAAMTKDSAM